jgi:hypothetical protein
MLKVLFCSFLFGVKLSDVGNEPKLQAKCGENRPYGHASQNLGLFVSMQWISSSNIIRKILYIDVIFLLPTRKCQDKLPYCS